MSELRVAVLGLGLAGRVLHLPALRRTPGVRVVAAADPDPATHPTKAAYPVVTDWQEALAVPADAVVVATPADTHAEIAIAAFAAGRHVYLEKPIATDLRTAEAVACAGQASRGIVQVGFAYRFHPLWRRLAALVRAGRLRPPLRGVGEFRPPTGGDGWRNPVVDVGCHHVDALSRVLGLRATEVTAATDGGLVVRWPDGSTLEGRYVTGPDVDVVRVDGIGGTVVVDRIRGTRITGPRSVVGRAGLPHPLLTLAHLANRRWEPAFDLAQRAFRDAVRRGSTNDGHPGLDAGVAAVAVGEATLRSLSSRQPEVVA